MADKKNQRPQRDLIVDLAMERYRFGTSDTGAGFAVPPGSHIALPLKGHRKALRNELALAFHAEHATVPAAAALGDALVLLEAVASRNDPETLALRTVEHNNDIWIDTGRADQQVIHISRDGWTITDSAPVLFRRNAATGAMPIPTQGGDIGDIWRIASVPKNDQDVVIGLLASAFIPDVPHFIAAFVGEQGTGKSEAMRFMTSLVDPSAAPTRTQPENVRDWVVAASASWVVALDNISYIPGWLSDALCRAATGDAMVRRALHTDGDLVIDSFQRVIMLDGIDLGALRGDLLDRLYLTELVPIPDYLRRPLRTIGGKAGVRDLGDELRPSILGALLDITAGMLNQRDQVKPDELPRMADAAVLFAAMDAAAGTESIERLDGARDNNMRMAVESDRVAMDVLKLATNKKYWHGTASDLLEAIRPDSEKLPRGYPTTAHHLSGRLRRVQPGLRTLGVHIEMGRDRESRWIRIEYDPDRTQQRETSPNGQSRDARDTGDAQNATAAPSRDAGDARDAESATELPPLIDTLEVPY